MSDRLTDADLRELLQAESELSPTLRTMQAMARELLDLRREVERLSAVLQRIDGGDSPCTDEAKLRQWAYEATTLGRDVGSLTP